ncbi:MAG: amidohydrolase family protein [Candidatus Zeuxoniibacter abyssi]|nr:MAG: amidohydrolase family protein [Candidatus Persebacteraceae bacterium AB1(2)]
MLIVDCDVHNNWNSADVLLPYLKGWWRDFYLRGERTGPAGSFPHGHRAWFHPEDFKRQDVRPQTEEDNYLIMKEKHLDVNGIDVAILTGDEPLEASTLGNPHLAAALVSAYNDWQIAEWLAKDERFYGSIIIAPQDPKLAAEEIHRLGSHPRMVQVISSHGSTMPYGDPYYHPIYEACNEVGLPFAIHLGGNGGINTQPIANGSPRYMVEAHTLLFQPAQTHLVSMIMNGVFEKYPDLIFVVIECGVSWVTPLLWRWDSNYKALRKETPWIKRTPSEYFQSNVRFSSQPLENPANKEHLWSTLEAMNAKETLMFASDYPHWDQDEISALRLPKEWHENIFGLNALNTYERLSHLRPTKSSNGATNTVEARA